MLRIQFERFLKQLGRLLAICRTDRFGQQKLNVGVRFELLRGGRQQFCGEREISFVKGQSSGCQKSIRSIGVVLSGSLKEAFLNGFCVGSECDRDPADRGQVVGIGISPRCGCDLLFDFHQGGGRLFLFAVGQSTFVFQMP